jgi:hypothetical protein
MCSVGNNQQLVEIDLEFWSYIQKTANSAYLEAYLNAFPSGTFALVAQARLNELKMENKRLQESTAFHDRFSPPWVVSFTKSVQLWDRPSHDALETKTVDDGRELIVLGTVGDGSWYRVLDNNLTALAHEGSWYGVLAPSTHEAYIPREAIEENGDSKVQLALADLHRAVALFDSDNGSRKNALASVRYGCHWPKQQRLLVQLEPR